MPQFDEHERELAEVERRIVEAELRITRQSVLIDRLARDGHDTTEAHALLNQMKGGLAPMNAHRRMLVRRSS